jgi:hypothetical protein
MWGGRVTGSWLNRIVYIIATVPRPYPSKVPRLLRGWIKYSRYQLMSRMHHRCGWRVLANKFIMFGPWWLGMMSLWPPL